MKLFVSTLHCRPITPRHQQNARRSAHLTQTNCQTTTQQTVASQDDHHCLRRLSLVLGITTWSPLPLPVLGETHHNTKAALFSCCADIRAHSRRQTEVAKTGPLEGPQNVRTIYKGASRRAALAARRFARRLHAMSSAVVVFAS